MRAGMLMFSLLVPTAAAIGSPPSSARELTEEKLIASLIAGLDDSDVEVRMNLGMALGQMGSKSVPPLIAALEQGGPNQRAGAAYALSQLRGVGKPAIPALVRALKAREDVVRRNASYALLRIMDATVDPPAAAASESLKPVLPPLDPVPGEAPMGGAR